MDMTNVIYRSESGLFECDAEGKLLHFYPAIDNLLDETVLRQRYTFQDSYYKPCVHTLIIPEGVVSLVREFFRYGLVQDRISFPDTMKSIGDESDDCVFANSSLPEVIIPESVGIIGRFAFGNGSIKVLRISNMIELPYLRQFKETRIDIMYLPKQAESNWERTFNGYAFLHDIDTIFY